MLFDDNILAKTSLDRKSMVARSAKQLSKELKAPEGRGRIAVSWGRIHDLASAVFGVI